MSRPWWQQHRSEERSCHDHRHPRSSRRTLSHPWKRLITVGRAYELLRQNVLDHLATLQRDIGFDAIRFHALFHDEMQEFARDAAGRAVYRWKHIDHIFDASCGPKTEGFVFHGAGSFSRPEARFPNEDICPVHSFSLVRPMVWMPS